MGQEGIAFKARERGSGGGLPTTAAARSGGASRVPRGRRIQKTFNNVKITVLCGFVTILVLRGTIGVGNLGGGGGGDDSAKVIEDIDRILAEIRSDSDPDEAGSGNRNDASSFMASFNATVNETNVAWRDLTVTYTLGPKISDWDEQRQAWLAGNPGFPSRFAGGRARILLVTGSQPAPCDNAIGDHYLLKATKNKVDYCRLHGIELVHNLAHLDRELAGYWAKLPLLRRLMLSHPEVEWIWWMDSDAFFTDMAFEIPLSKYDAHNLVVHGYPDLMFEKKSWIALNTGSFLLRNCQWSLDLLDAWAPMGPKGVVREAAGRLLTANLQGRPAFEADDQSALIYLLLFENNGKWMDKVILENSYYLHGFWEGLVDRYEDMMEKNHPGLGDERWPFVTHFVGCKPCGSYGDYPVERCLSSMERAFNFADNQVVRMYGFSHKGLSTPNLKRIRNETARPLDAIDELGIAAQAVAGR